LLHRAICFCNALSGSTSRLALFMTRWCWASQISRSTYTKLLLLRRGMRLRNVYKRRACSRFPHFGHKSWHYFNSFVVSNSSKKTFTSYFSWAILYCTFKTLL